MRIKIENISKSYVRNQLVLQPLDLTIESGELFFLLGPSGCGKSTLLRLIAGFIAPDSGRIWFDNKDVTLLPPERRNAPMVFQNYALWPHLTVFENVAFGLRSKNMKNSEIRKQVMAALEQVRMADFAERKTPQLSGGQQQRVALARALAVAPELILLDEPLSNLDAKLRDEMREELQMICRMRKLTAIYVTHDRREALSMADRMAVLDGGRISQIGRPDELYRHPANCFAAAFLGDMNFVDGVVNAQGNVDSNLGTFCDIELGKRPAGTRVTLGFRPETVRFSPDLPCSWQSNMELTGGSYLGEFASWKFGSLLVNEIAPEVRKIGSVCRLGVRSGDITVFDQNEA